MSNEQYDETAILRNIINTISNEVKQELNLSQDLQGLISDVELNNQQVNTPDSKVYQTEFGLVSFSYSGNKVKVSVHKGHPEDIIADIELVEGLSIFAEIQDSGEWHVKGLMTFTPVSFKEGLKCSVIRSNLGVQEDFLYSLKIVDDSLFDTPTYINVLKDGEIQGVAYNMTTNSKGKKLVFSNISSRIPATATSNLQYIYKMAMKPNSNSVSTILDLTTNDIPIKLTYEDKLVKATFEFKNISLSLYDIIQAGNKKALPLLIQKGEIVVKKLRSGFTMRIDSRSIAKAEIGDTPNGYVVMNMPIANSTIGTTVTIIFGSYWEILSITPDNSGLQTQKKYIH